MSLNQRSYSAAPADSYHSSNVGGLVGGVAIPGGLYYRSNSPRRGSLSSPEDRYIDYSIPPVYGGSGDRTVLGGTTAATTTASASVSAAASAGTSTLLYGATITGSQQQSQHRFQSRSATATPTGSPKKRQLPQVCIEWNSFSFYCSAFN